MNDTYNSNLRFCEQYKEFRGKFCKQRLILDDDSKKVWTFYDTGPKTVKSPIVFLPPVSGTADVFFLQLIELSKQGYRAIAIQYPIYWTINEFITGFLKFIDHFQLDHVHLFGASLGGFLAQKFVENANNYPNVSSIILCNSFSDTTIFNFTDSASIFWLMPSVLLRKMFLDKNITENSAKDYDIANSVTFMTERLNDLSSSELASRLTLNCTNSYIEPQKIQKVSISILDVFDECALSETAREELYKLYPDAKRCHMKSGGNFPYLSRPDEVNMYILIHLKQFDETNSSAKAI